MYLASGLLIIILCNGIQHLEASSIQKSSERQSKKLVAEGPKLGLSDNIYSPIIFIPGDGGSRLEAKLNKTHRVHYVCAQVSDWFNLWVNIRLLAPPWIDCTVDNLKLYYNSTDRTTHDSPGVEIRPTKFGSLIGVDNLGAAKWTNYFESIIDKLEKNNNLSRDVDMLGAPFDFRKAPNELGEFFHNLTELIQDTYFKNNYSPVTLICHSMGCLNSLYLLNGKSQKWKDVFIRRLITLGAPWQGSFKALSAMLFGDNLGVILLSSEKLQGLQSTFPSLMYLFPRSPAFQPDRVLVQTPTINYTLGNLDEIFSELDMSDQREMWHDTRSIAANLTAPEVELWCLYGGGVATPSKIIFDGPLGLGHSKHHELHDDGDGTVNLDSLRACESFKQEKPIYTRMFEGVDHVGVLRTSEVANFISDTIMKRDDLKPYDTADEMLFATNDR